MLMHLKLHAIMKNFHLTKLCKFNNHKSSFRNATHLKQNKQIIKNKTGRNKKKKTITVLSSIILQNILIY